MSYKQELLDGIIDSDEITIHSDDIPNPKMYDVNKIIRLIFYKNGSA